LKNLKQSMIEAGRILYEKNLLAGFDGNISIRTEKGVWITASESYKGFLKEEDLVLIDFSGKMLEGSRKASSEAKLHLKIYEKRPDISHVIHAHPVKSTALTIAGIPLIPCLTAEAYLLLGKVPLAPYQAPGSIGLASSIERFVKQTNFFLLEKHGAGAFGNDFYTCIDRLEKIEALAEKTWLLLSAGIPIEKKVFTPKERKELNEIKKKAGFLNISCECTGNKCRLLKKALKKQKKDLQ